MGNTSPELRQRVKRLAIRIAAIQGAGPSLLPTMADTLAELQAEHAGWKLLLVTRRLQLQDKVINLACWRDGYAFNPRRPSAAKAILGQAVAGRRERGYE